MLHSLEAELLPHNKYKCDQKSLGHITLMAKLVKTEKVDLMKGVCGSAPRSL